MASTPDVIRLSGKVSGLDFSGWVGMTLWKDVDYLDENVSIIQNDDPDWSYVIGTDDATGYFCVLVFDEDGYLAGTL